MPVDAGQSRWMKWFAPQANSSIPQRWVVLDVETSGLGPHTDKLIAVAALGVLLQAPNRLVLGPNDSFEVVVEQNEPSSSANILLHGIGVRAQASGVPPGQALTALASFVGASPLLAFHAGFDQTVLKHACRAAGLAPWANAWLDIGTLCQVAVPGHAARSLDDWMEVAQLRCANRHNAMADAWVEAELVQWALARVDTPVRHFKHLSAIAAQKRWLPSVG